MTRPSPSDIRLLYGRWNAHEQEPPADVFHDPMLDRWIVGGYETALAVMQQRLENPNADQREGCLIKANPDQGSSDVLARAQALFLKTSIFQESPDWERLRKVTMSDLGARAMRDLAPRLTDTARGLVAAAVQRGSLDVVGDIARPLIHGGLFDLLGAQDSEQAALRRLGEAASILFELGVTPLEQKVGLMAFAGLCRSSGRLLANHAAEAPLLSGLREAVANGDVSEDEAVAQIATLIIAVMVTPVTAVATMIHLLATHPDVWAAARQGRLSRAAIIEECLRLGPPGTIKPKTTSRDVDVGDAKIPAGDKIIVLIRRANRDSKAFEDPMAFNPWRAKRRNLTFGAGRRKCPGRHLSHAQLHAVLDAFLDRFDRLELVQPAEWSRSLYGEAVISRLEIRV